jgi:hypothetical protein
MVSSNHNASVLMAYDGDDGYDGYSIACIACYASPQEKKGKRSNKDRVMSHAYTQKRSLYKGHACINNMQTDRKKEKEAK